MPIYAWPRIPIHLEMTEENAAAYNRVTDALMENAPIPDDQLDAMIKDKLVWEKVIRIIMILVELNDGDLPYPQEYFNIAHLVKVAEEAKLQEPWQPTSCYQCRTEVQAGTSRCPECGNTILCEVEGCRAPMDEMKCFNLKTCCVNHCGEGDH